MAVLGTLLYLAVQVKHGNDFARDDASKVWTDYNFDLSGRVAADRDLAKIWVKAESEFAGLDVVDQQRLIMNEWRAIDAFHHAFHSHKSGILPDHQWNKIPWLVEGAIGRRQSVREAWRSDRGSYDSALQALMDRHLADP